MPRQRVVTSQRLLALVFIVLALMLAGCGFFGEADETTSDVTPQVAGTSATRKISATSGTTLNNENWDLAVKDADSYKGLPVDITGQIFNVIGDYENASHYQLFTNPTDRTGNTHLALSLDMPKLEEGDTVHVLGTLDRMLVVSSRGGAELKLPYVVGDQVEITGPPARAALFASPTPEPTAPPIASPTATATVAELSPSPVPVTTTVAIVSTPTIVPTAETVTATTTAPATNGTATTSSASTVTTSAPGFNNGVSAVDFSPNEAMDSVGDSNAPSGKYLVGKTSTREWDGNGTIPAGAATASQEIEIPHAGRYIVWLRLQYRNVDGNSLWLLVDNNRAIVVGNEDGGYGTWKWVGWRDGNSNAKLAVELAPGPHTFTIVSREAGTRFDRMLLTDDANYRPVDAAPTAVISQSAPATANAPVQPPAPVQSAPSATAPSATAAPNTPTSAPSNSPKTTSTAIPTRAPPPTNTTIPTATPAKTATPAPSATPPPGAGGGSYTVQSGDTLSAIAQHEYGDASQFQRIYAANRDKLSSPDRIVPGTQLVIPR